METQRDVWNAAYTENFCFQKNSSRTLSAFQYSLFSPIKCVLHWIDDHWVRVCSPTTQSKQTQALGLTWVCLCQEVLTISVRMKTHSGLDQTEKAVVVVVLMQILALLFIWFLEHNGGLSDSLKDSGLLKTWGLSDNVQQLCPNDWAYKSIITQYREDSQRLVRG